MSTAYFKPGKLNEVVLSNTEKQIRDLIVRYAEHYNSTNHTHTSEPLVARVTGGWVRDKLLGLGSNDLDIAVNLITGLEFAEGLNDFITANLQDLPGGIDIGVIHKIEKNPEKSKHLETATTRLFGLEIDFVNLRNEEYAADSRIPEKTTFGTPEQDAFRRDATLNALFYNLQENKVEDFTGRGLKDLEAGILQTPLPAFTTFDEDPLRVLRLMRFACTYGFELSSECLTAMKDPHICQALMKKISRERVGIEIAKALTSNRPEQCLQLVQDTGLYHAIFNLDEMFYPRDPKKLAEFQVPEADLTPTIEAVELALEKAPPALVSTVLDPVESKLQFWLSVALNPWEGITAVDEKQKPIAAINRIVRDGLKLTAHDAVTVAKVTALHESRLAGFAHSNSLSRCEVGLLVRDCGPQWPLVFLYSFFKDLINSRTTTDGVVEKYTLLTEAVHDHDLADAWDLKPILNGKELAQLYGSKGGRWMAPALQCLVEYQLANPKATKDQATEYMLAQKSVFL